MKLNCKLWYFSLFLLIFLLSAYPASAEIHSTQEATATYYHVSGNTSRSFYPDNDVDWLYEGSVDFKTPLNGYEWYGNINYRATNDDLIDSQSFSIERMFMGLKGANKDILMGDFYSNFTDYSLSNAIKGAKIVLGGDKSTSRLILVGGMDTSKWEDLWENRVDDTNSRRYVWGSRLENNLIENKLFLNFNYGGARDDTAYVSPSGNPILVNVFSVDSKYVINSHLTASGEIAESFTDENLRNDDQKTKSDYATKLGLDLNLKDYSLSTIYSRVGNHFNTTGGFSAQDLEAWSIDGMWYLPLKVKFSHYFRMDRDNLSDTKSTTTKQLNPGGKFSFTLPKDVAFSLGADYRKRYSVDKTTNEKTYTYTSNLGKDFGIVYATLGYTRTKVTNRVSAAQERHSDLYSIGFDGSFNLKDVKFNWNAGEDIERTAYKSSGKADFTTSTLLGLKAAFPSTLTFIAKATIGDNNYFMNETDSYNTYYYGEISRNILRRLLKDSLTFDVSYEHKGYSYFDNANNYAETILKGRFTYTF